MVERTIGAEKAEIEVKRQCGRDVGVRTELPHQRIRGGVSSAVQVSWRVCVCNLLCDGGYCEHIFGTGLQAPHGGGGDVA